MLKHTGSNRKNRKPIIAAECTCYFICNLHGTFARCLGKKKKQFNLLFIIN